MRVEGDNTKLTEPADDSSTPDEGEVQMPIVPVESDATPAPPARQLEETTLPEPQAAAFDLSVPILEVLTDPTM
ncbi:acetyl-CoA carboxylase [Arcanobacterium pinnipediorum]|uniref:Acetyl-CoA carboxylase n=1 Tax=Arcanobacterium pinnipediorum TaxID=1503041 RepID=A0ABY5AIX2_9ACTO|nr:acetyl-CoA carboxylase [Arcanobacterium pinnipediorum]USR79888.1 acetyl-CoA carboxylase [Arcanobacterium pinnipediorum]